MLAGVNRAVRKLERVENMAEGMAMGFAMGASAQGGTAPKA